MRCDADMLETSHVPCEAEFGVNWLFVYASARRFLAANMGGFRPEDLEDAAQEVCERLLTFVRRNGPPRSLESIVYVIAHRVAANAVTRLVRQKKLRGDPEIPDRIHPDQEPERRLQEAIQTAVFLIREYLLLRRASCVELLDLKLSGGQFATYAAACGRSQGQVRQAWERCMQGVREAVRRGRLPIPWLPSPSASHR